ncbi:MAG: ADP-forming succinate--CoA ligase subunit beta [Marinifilaceae bacterium]|jgi:succinyl-CoA synthetase beta subunit|nr:ADP-forming succinate--CoA ligase subunit beta [Marinifilaceae bacterium]
MKIHEYQAKEILRRYGISVPKSKIIEDTEEAENAALEVGLPVVIKAQIHAGGRGKGGGVKFAPSIQDVKKISNKMLGMQLRTHQTGPNGQKVRKLLIEAASNIKSEFYVGLIVDRSKSCISFMVSAEGGMDIEEIAEKSPEKILKLPINTALGIQAFQARKLAFFLNLRADAFNNAVKFFILLYHAFVETDASLFEVNPMVLTNENEIIALDAKANFDDNALYRRSNIYEYRDVHEEDELELKASEANLNYIKLDGNIGCMVNGAGLAMATMDIIKLSGAEPANFLDVGGSASAETVEKGFKIILSDPNVKAILINIFGGIVRCDRVANGVVEAIKNAGLSLPIVVRLQGTNAEIGKEILENSGLNIIAATELKDAAEKVVSTLK